MVKTKQELFDAAWLGLVSQGRKSVDFKTNICQYNGPGGRHCGVGWLLTHLDPEVVATFEGKGISTLMHDGKSKQYLVEFEGSLALLSEIQECHDELNALMPFVPKLYEGFKRIAERFELDTRVLNP
jgi:hypothetical protein